MQDKTTKEPFPPSENVSWTVHHTGLQPAYAISLIPGNGGVDGIKGDQVCLAPPFNSSRREIEMIVDRVTRVVRKVLG